MRGLITVVLLALGGLGAGVALGDEKPTVRMGVRVDAPPFAWRDEANDSYLGFLVDLCTDAVARANYPFEQVPITALDRRAFFRGERRDLDLLCDPTTLTLGRMDDFVALQGTVDLQFSPIVFVANGVYVENKATGAGVIAVGQANPATCHDPLPVPPQPAPAEATGSQVKPSTDAAPADAPPPTVYLAAGFLLGATSEQILADAIRDGRLAMGPGEKVCPVEKLSHWDAARDFCDGKLRYYFGDQDILRTVLEKEATTRAGCTFEPSVQPLSYEPYALIVTGRTQRFRQEFVKALYEVFHHRTADHRFRGNFEGRPMSPFLDTLFRINQVPAGAVAQTDAPKVAAGPGPAADARAQALR